MEDNKIITLFFERSQDAIKELSEKYGKAAHGISLNILKNKEDAEESVNDAYLALWNNIPPVSPSSLRAYFFRTVRNQSLYRYRLNTAKKRNSFYDTALEELENLLFSENSVEDEINTNEITEAINRFLAQEARENRIIFIRRYFYCDSTGDISELLGKSPHFVSVRLSRTRERLKNYLRKEDLL